MLQFKIFKDQYGVHGKFSILNINLQIKLHKEYQTITTIGVRNNVGSFRVIFLDYDSYKLEFLMDELKYLQGKYMLSDFYIFKSSQKQGGYHAICLDKLYYREFLEAMSYTACDDYYKTMPITNDFRSWVLRIQKKAGSDKPKLVKVLKSEYQNRTKSLAHALFLKYNYGVDIKHLKNLDQNKKLYVVNYGTLNYIKLKK